MKFYGSCLKRAFTGWFKRVEGWTSSVALVLAVILLFVKPVPAIRESLQGIPAGFFIVIFLSIILVRLFVSPYLLFRDEQMKRAALESARKPALSLTLPEPPVIQTISQRGHTSETLGGTRQTVISGWELDVVTLTCTNTGETKATGCRARLMSMTKVLENDENELRVVSPIALPWEKENPEANLVVDLAPNETRRIWIGGVRTHGHVWLFREIKSLPVEYQQLLGEAGAYRLLIQLDGDNIAPQQIEIEILAAEGPKPEIGVWRGEADVTICAQGSPRIEPSSEIV